MTWKFQDESILHDANPKDIFKAVCEEIGMYYTEKGKTYRKSNRLITWQGERLRYQVGLCSSRSNTKGKYIALEIVTTLFSINAEGMDGDGVLNFPLNVEVPHEDAKKVIIKQIDKSVLEREPHGNEIVMVKYNNHCNLYDFDNAMFENIIDYINRMAIKAETLETKQGIDDLLKKCPKTYIEYFWKYKNNVLYYNLL